MNPALVHTPFSIDGPVGSDSDYITQERVFPGPAGLSADDLVDHNRRPGSLAHPISVPVSNNGFRYAAHQQAGGNNEVPFQQSNGFLLSPAESCSGSGPPSANSASSSYGYNTHPQIYSNNVTSSESFTSAPSSLFPSLWNDKNMSDYNRTRVPAPHLPGLSPPTSQANPASLSTSIVNGSRVFGEHYSTAPSYQVQRPLLSPPHVNHQEISRFTSGFSTSPPHLDNSASSLSSPGTVYSNTPNMPYEHSARGSNSSEEKTPPFEKTTPLCPICDHRNRPLDVDINAKISKGFFKVDSKWTCYRRNYFSVTCGFSLLPPDLPSDTPVYIRRSNQQTPEPIHKFYVAISAKTAVNSNEQESETRDLVQHTPKRDKASESTPVPMPVRPAQTVQSAVGGMGNRLYGYPTSMMTDYSSYAATSQTTPMSHTFERIQFVKATANNGKRRAQQQYYRIVVDLLAEVGSSREKIKIATVESDPMVVRGRSPGHYKDNERRGSHTNGDPDRGPSSGREVGGGSAAMPPSMSRGPMSSSMDWESGHGRGSQMGGRNYSNFNNAEYVSSNEDSGGSSPETKDFAASGTQYHSESAASMLSSANRSNAVLLEDVVGPPAEMMSEPDMIRCNSSTQNLQPAPFMEVNQTWQPVLPSFPTSWNGRSLQRKLPGLDGSFEGSAEPLSSSHNLSQYSSHQALPYGETKLPDISQSRDIPISENYVTAF